MRYIVGFNRDRDRYEVPAALAEVGDLDTFVTDYYAGKGWRRIGALSHRSHPLISPSKVQVVNRAFMIQFAHETRGRFAYPGRFPVRAVDDSIGDALAKRAARNPTTGLLIYSGYARQAFELDAPKERSRLLYQFHPTADGIRAAMAHDELGSMRPWRPEPELDGALDQSIYDREIELASGILAASAFTARSLVASGAQAPVQITPYGVPTPGSAAPARSSTKQTFTFLGQGTQRKGLHLLLTAWKRLRPQSAELVVAGPTIDPEISELARGVESVNIVGRVSAPEKRLLLDRTDTLVLPSLVEGFGLVLGEALARGCRLIASANTGLHDLALPSSIATVVNAGEVGPLAAALERNMQTYDFSPDLPPAIQAEALTRSWSAFREGLRKDVRELEVR